MHGILQLVLCTSSLLLLTATTTNADNLTFYMSSACPDDTNYTRGSAFQANLDALLSSLPAAAAAASFGFAENVTGAAPDQAFGLAQCRGDISASQCACLVDSAQEMASKCPGQKRAVLIYEGCLLRYSDASFSGEVDTSNPLYMCDPANATEPQFAASLDALMRGLAVKAAHGSSPRMFAAGSANFTLNDKIYGMAQCTRDLGPDDCQGCLANAVSKIQAYKSCSGRQGGRIFNWSCSIRFQLTPFFNAQAAEAVMSTAARRSRTGRSTALLISVPVAITLLLLLLLAVYICKTNKKPHKHVQSIAGDGHGDDEEMRSSNPHQYDLSTLRAATNNFSEENKLGKGGFGPSQKISTNFKAAS